ncbi:hypothetical protein BIU87_28895 [Streptomyces sp. ZS0098]|nr:hypothetical protein BIU87_28895 [Streptomyces sp. ZS0098]
MTLEATMGTWAGLPLRHAVRYRRGGTGRCPVGPVPTSAQTVLSGGGPGTTPQRSASVPFLDAGLRLRNQDEVFQNSEEVDAVGHRGRGLDQC